MRGSVAIGVGLVALVGCATILGIEEGIPRDSCAQFDFKSDPSHCGACDKACAAVEVCSQGVCKSKCDAPLARCGADGGSASCADLTNDPKHCGSCTTTCPKADAGALEAGANNPTNTDAGAQVSYDSGVGWSTGNPACTSSKCAIACPQGMTQCADGVCYDTLNFHDRCGSCMTACNANDWCALGHCCATDELFCNGKCGDVLADPVNCGACNNACSGMTPYCVAGVCASTCAPTGARRPFNVLFQSSGGCYPNNPCNLDNYVQAGPNIASFQAPNATLVCGGTTACVSHVGIDTYQLPSNCQGSWDVYCDKKIVGSINTAGKGCAGSAMSNGCDVTFPPAICSSIKLVAVSGTGTPCCTSASPVDTRIVAVSAW